MTVRIHNILREGTHVLGPGCRYVIWVQGCHKRCPGCISPESRPMEEGTDIACSDIAADIILNRKIDGITLSGGEPFLQAKALSEMLKTVKRYRPKLTVIVYTGYRIEELAGVADADSLMAEADVIIDGPYEQEKNDNKGIRGSSNQRIIAITNRLDAYIGTMQNGTRHIQQVAYNSEVAWTVGVPPTTSTKE